MYDYLIIGHGLAGAILSYRLIEQGEKIMVLDQPEKNASSVVAAGLFNPVTGRKMLKTWRADDFFPELGRFYPAMEKKLNSSFFHPIGIYRPYASQEDQNDWEAKKTDDKFKPYIHSASTSHINTHKLNDPYGGLFLDQSGYVDIRSLLEANKKYLSRKGYYKETMFYEQELKHHSNHFSFGDLKFKKIIFCNGVAANESDWFNWLPFSPVKGEVIDIELKNIPNTIYNRGVFILPFKKERIRVGSTYHKNFEDLEPTEAGLQELKDKLNSLLAESYNVNDAQAGVRPATKDRRPFIGKHPDNEHIYIFNGFGSKGVSLIPYCSKLFTDHLLNGEALDEDMDVSRFYKLYPSKTKNL